MPDNEREFAAARNAILNAPLKGTSELEEYVKAKIEAGQLAPRPVAEPAPVPSVAQSDVDPTP